MFSSILAAIAAIPEMIGAIRELLAWKREFDKQQFFKKSAEVFNSINTAKTSEERANAAKNLSDLMSSL